jgi:hypothetical protein
VPAEAGVRVGRLPSGVRIAFQALQVREQLGGSLVTQVAVLLQRLVDDAVQFRRQVRLQPGRRRGRPVEDGVEDGRRGAPRKDRAPRGHLVKHQAEAEQIAARIHLVSQRLLGRHVGHRPQRRARAGERVDGEGGRLGR